MLSQQDSRHARLVTGLKIALPLMALGVLATLFLFSREIDPTRALPYADVDVEDLTRDPRISAPRFASVTEDGTAMTVTARSVRSAPGGAVPWVTAEGITAILDAGSGGRSAIAAETARLDEDGGTLVLDGNLRMSTDAGYDLRAEGMALALDRTRLDSIGTITAEGPPGRITAGAMSLRAAPGVPGEATQHVLVFTDGVNLIYDPKSRE